MYLRDFYKEYNKINKVNTKEGHEKLEYFLKNAVLKEKEAPRGLFDAEHRSSILQPSDYCREVSNEKENVHRMMYNFLAINQPQNATICLKYLIKNYRVNNSLLWRAGFHIFNELGSNEQLYHLFKILMKMNISDRKNMIYEYLLCQMRIKHYEGVRQICGRLFPHIIMPDNRYKSKVENDLLGHLIKLTGALACYYIWKKSETFSKEFEDIEAYDQAMLYFRELVPLIHKGESVDNYLLNYIELMESKSKYEEALKILNLYNEKCHQNFNSTRFLLEFLIKHKRNLKDITDEIILSKKVAFILKMMPIDPFGETSIMKILTSCKDELLISKNYELLATILFELLDNTLWQDKIWPWKTLVKCIKILGVDNKCVKEEWLFRRKYWTKIYFPKYRNVYIMRLSKLLI